MDLKRLTDKAKDLVEKRGGSDSLREDAAELRKIADGQGSLGDKAKAAVAAIKDPGEDEAKAPTADATTPTEPAEGDEKARRKRRNERGRDGDPAV